MNQTHDAIITLIPILFVVIPLIGLLCTALWIWMLIDCAMNEPAEGNDKVVWIVVIALTHVLGALIYLVVRRPQRRAQYGR
jgi:sterol desaturase/sphingolipid hydroxylase (fatty acid hydroxylase superfamily)